MTSQATLSHCVAYKSSYVSTNLVSHSHVCFTILIEETMANELQGRLLHLGDSPTATTLPALVDLDALTSPQRSAQHHDPHVRRLRTVPSDPCLVFSQPKPRAASGSEVRELRIAALRAEEDASIIAQLEGALADARDSEEAQRKAAARLRRDLSRMKRELEHAEDVITDHQRIERTMSEAGRRRSVERVAQWTQGTASLARTGGGYGPPSDEGVVGWGATCFPEFPREDESHAESEAATEVAVHTHGREASPHNEVVVVSATTLSDAASVSDAQSEETISPVRAVAAPERSLRSRPLITSTTFASPSCDTVGDQRTPQVTINPPTTRPSSAQGSAVVMAPRRTRSLKTKGSGSNLLKESMRVRTQSFASGHERLSPPTRTRKISSGSEGLHARSPSASTASACSEQSRIDSVRSIYSAVVGLHRSLGSELGSLFHPTPTKEGEEATVRQSPVRAAPFTPVNIGLRQYHIRQPSSPTATFHFRGTLESPSRANAYDYEHPDAPQRMGPVADQWSPHSWPTPCPPPRDVSVPSIPDVYCSEDQELPELRTPLPYHAKRASWPAMPGAGPGVTPSPRASTGLAPCVDPWDEYSDRPTPSPRMRNLRPLLLCTKPAMHARTSSLALARDRSATGAGFKFAGMVRVPPQPIPEPTPSTAVVAYARGAAHALAPSYVNTPPVIILPVTVPGRIMHDLFCLVLVFIDYLEWFIILLYRFSIDVRAGPGGAEPAL